MTSFYFYLLEKKKDLLKFKKYFFSHGKSFAQQNLSSSYKRETTELRRINTLLQFIFNHFVSHYV